MRRAYTQDTADTHVDSSFSSKPPRTNIPRQRLHRCNYDVRLEAETDSSLGNESANFARTRVTVLEEFNAAVLSDADLSSDWGQETR